MIHATENEQELMIDQYLQSAFDQAQSSAVSANVLVRVLVDHGVTRELAVSKLHQEIASGHLVLTDGFMVAPGH